MLIRSGIKLTPAEAADPFVHIYSDERFRYIRSNGIPDHVTGSFPNRGNPNTISEQNYLFRFAKEPKFAGYETTINMFPFGVAVNGIPFDPAANEFWHRDRNSGWQYEAMALVGRLGMDENNAHVQPNGAYHYHGPPTGLLEKLGQEKPTLVGFAADGFPIYGPYCYSDANNKASSMKKLQSSYRVRSGTRPSGPGGEYSGIFVQDYEFVSGLGDLDECNGRYGITPEYPEGTYYYVLTDTFPFIPRVMKGAPDPTFLRHGHQGPPPGGFPPPPGFGPPPQ
jgi:hypothetical protein